MSTRSQQINRHSYISHELPFVRQIYRTLFARKRAYAAFEKKQLVTMIEKISPKAPILDPMSGYGVLAEVARGLKLDTCCMEVNPSSYLWQILNEPNSGEGLRLAIQSIEKASKKIKHSKEFEHSDSWFPSESIAILQSLWAISLDDLAHNCSEVDAEISLAAVLLPFLGRFASCAEGMINIQIKKGGLVFFDGWKSDLTKYLYFLSEFISHNDAPFAANNEILLLDALQEYKIDKKYSYIITSPPYPNMRDYYTFFNPENYAIEKIFRPKSFTFDSVREHIIGSAKVSNFKKNNDINFNLLSSTHAKKFLLDLEEWKGPKRSIQDNKSYYIPYYYRYFLQLEKSYENIEKILSDKFDGYIIVVNNTARKFVIPVAQAIQELWQSLGCNAVIDESLTNERAHVGSINPRAVGFKARHMEYAIRISRG